jgi:O-antigen ligase
MNQSAQWITNGIDERSERNLSRHFSSLKFLGRYPIFLLALGPPIFRATGANKGVDTSQAHFGFWNVIQVAWIALPTARAIIRLIFARSLHIPSQIQTVLRLAFFLGLLYMASVVYSPGRVVSAEFSLLYFATLICVVEFVVDVYRDPPNWVRCLFQLRRLAFFSLILVLGTLLYDPAMVLSVTDAGLRLTGGAIGQMTLLGPLIAIISAYSFLHSLESKVQSAFSFLVGLAGTLITQTRGAEIALFLVLTFLGIQWSKKSGRATYSFISGLIASILVAVAAVAAFGGDRIWNVFNRGQSSAEITSFTGRTELWTYAFTYCIKHPQGMGYVAGFRYYFTRSLNFNLGSNVANLGTSHNAYVQVLADAGWLALLLYLIMNARIVALGWRFSGKQVLLTFASEGAAPHGIRCAMLLLLFCFMEGMESSVFNIPLQQSFYFQWIIVAIILGASTRMLVASRARRLSLVK